jgi:predicted PurR-regulated permease PerM
VTRRGWAWSSVVALFLLLTAILGAALVPSPTFAQIGGGTTDFTNRAQNDDDNRQYDDDNRQYDDDNQKNRITIVEEQTVIIRTIPAKPLPPTGGLQVYVMVGVSILVGAGLLAGRLAARRGRHR